MKSMTASGKEHRIAELPGHGKGGYSYLAEADAGVPGISETTREKNER